MSIIYSIASLFEVSFRVGVLDLGLRTLAPGMATPWASSRTNSANNTADWGQSFAGTVQEGGMRLG